MVFKKKLKNFYFFSECSEKQKNGAITEIIIFNLPALRYNVFFFTRAHARVGVYAHVYNIITINRERDNKRHGAPLLTEKRVKTLYNAARIKKPRNFHG